MKSYRTRWDFIRPYVEGKKVLDVGPAELVGTAHKHKEERWLHKKMASVAAEVIGLEINEEQARALRNMGYDIRLGDAESFDLSETFDVIVAGELIEHLSNPGEFLKCTRRHLRPNGILLLTTPNRFGGLAFLKVLRRNRVSSYNKPIAKHVIYFDEDSIKSLLTRYGFSDIVITYYEAVGDLPKDRKTRLLNAFLRRYRPVLLSGLLVSALVREGSARDDEG